MFPKPLLLSWELLKTQMMSQTIFINALFFSTAFLKKKVFRSSLMIKHGSSLFSKKAATALKTIICQSRNRKIAGLP
jgi:hypothetical protein